ncbi:MAG: hypothetical protein KDH09_03780 [Chrysiogenetes bacterium]|nr:hypothetical protein [Chrysiogenetes bacterium]
MLTPNEQDNLVVWDPSASRGHVESYFMKANDPASRRAFWLKFTLFARPGQASAAVGDVWAIFFNADTHEHVALRNQFPARECTLGRDHVEVKMGASEFHTGRSVGDLKLDDQSIKWDLTFDTSGAPFHHFPSEKLYKGRFPKSKALSPYPDSSFTGTITVNGEKVAIDGWPGMQGHNWGEQHTPRYAWGHCNLFDGNPEDTFFEGFTGRILVGGVMIPPVTRTFLRYKGTDYPLLSAKGTLWPPATIRYDQWDFQSEGQGYVLEGSLKADKRDMVGLYYKNPEGPNTDCLNSKLARCDLRLFETNGRKRTLVTELHSAHGAALEVAIHEGESHGVRMTV